MTNIDKEMKYKIDK